MADSFSAFKGPVLGQTFDGEGETKGVFGGEGKTIKEVGTSGNFDLRGKNYVGPENWTPTNRGDVSPKSK